MSNENLWCFIPTIDKCILTSMSTTFWHMRLARQPVVNDNLPVYLPHSWLVIGVASSPAATICTPWASCQIRKTAGCAWAGNAGNVFPPPQVCDPDVHHDTWGDRQLAVSFEVGGREYVPGIYGACATRNFKYLVRGPLNKQLLLVFEGEFEEPSLIKYLDPNALNQTCSSLPHDVEGKGTFDLKH